MPQWGFQLLDEDLVSKAMLVSPLFKKLGRGKIVKNSLMGLVKLGS